MKAASQTTHGVRKPWASSQPGAARLVALAGSVWMVMALSACAGTPVSTASNSAGPAAAAQPAPAPVTAARPATATLGSRAEVPAAPIAAPVPTPPARPANTPVAAPPAARVAAAPAAPASAPPRAAQAAAAAPALDLKSLESRLKATSGIGLFTKLTLKNQVDDLLDKFRSFYKGDLAASLAQLRQSYDQLVLKVLALLQDGDPPLAKALASSRESIWGVLSDRNKFAAV